mmetsp:Transcript_14268/g.15815  ORF Transcript_14268/g.15815 Transcript_14268/m.15815 type:complete len:93 (-) Transcript_14268:1561-1839(-)
MGFLRFFNDKSTIPGVNDIMTGTGIFNKSTPSSTLALAIGESVIHSLASHPHPNSNSRIKKRKRREKNYIACYTTHITNTNKLFEKIFSSGT